MSLQRAFFISCTREIVLIGAFIISFGLINSAVTYFMLLVLSQSGEPCSPSVTKAISDKALQSKRDSILNLSISAFKKNSGFQRMEHSLEEIFTSVHSSPLISRLYFFSSNGCGLRRKNSDSPFLRTRRTPPRCHPASIRRDCRDRV